MTDLSNFETQEFRKKIAEIIKAERKKRYGNAEDAANLLGIKRYTFNQIERGRIHIEIGRLFDICRVLKIDIVDVIKKATDNESTK
jgi:transcriptional regulator with XRE-family HTH domain